MKFDLCCHLIQRLLNLSSQLNHLHLMNLNYHLLFHLNLQLHLLLHQNHRLLDLLELHYLRLLRHVPKNCNNHKMHKFYKIDRLVHQ